MFLEFNHKFYDSSLEMHKINHAIEENVFKKTNAKDVFCLPLFI